MKNHEPGLNAIRFAASLAAALAASAVSSQAQGIIASASLSGVAGAGNAYDYTLTLSDGASATTPIEGFWYAWIPGHFFLPSVPSSASGAASGWSATVDGNSIQFQGSSANAIAPGHSATFTFVTADSPAALAGQAGGFPIGDSVAYPGTINFSGSSPNEVIAVQSVPEPSTLGLVLTGSLGFLAVGWRQRGLRRR